MLFLYKKHKKGCYFDKWKGGRNMNTIITIGRQFGSGGHVIGEKLAQHYGIKYFVLLKEKVAFFISNVLYSSNNQKVNRFS